jgi:hypothetical protein
VEIYSEHGNSEGPDAPARRACTWDSGTVQTALRDGDALGFVAGSDNHGGRMGTPSELGAREGNRRTGLTAVIAAGLTRRDVWDAIKARRTYATTGAQRIIVEFSVNGHSMGEEFTTASPRTIRAEVAGTDTVESIEVLRNGEVVRQVSGSDWHEIVEWTDPQARGHGGIDYYYVRVTQRDANIAWSSPVWVRSSPPEGARVDGQGPGTRERD